MVLQHWVHVRSYLVVVALGLSACQHMPFFNKRAASSGEIDPSQQIDVLGGDLQKAKNEQVDILSPSHFSQAEEAYTAALVARRSNYGPDEIMRYVNRTRSHLEEAQKTAAIARTALPEVVNFRGDALQAKANEYFPKEFKAADSDLRQVTHSIENNKLGAAEDRKDALAKTYGELELQAIRKSNLQEAIEHIQAAISEGAEQLAPRTLTKAKNDLKSAETFISEHRHEQDAIKGRAQVATESAQHLLVVTRQVKKTERKDGESLVLDSEAQEAQIASEQAKIQSMNQEVESAQQNAGQLQAQNNQMAAERKFVDQLDKAKATFDPKEAEVFRDGNRLIIRLKSIAFPSGKANLPEGSFAVLGKVHSVMQQFNDSHVVIEGHTDSVGGSVRNQKLSEDRASVIKNYFVSLGANPSNIDTVGRGDTSPLTSNKTKAGKAQNRRVDVIIEPRGVTAS